MSSMHALSRLVSRWSPRIAALAVAGGLALAPGALAPGSAHAASTEANGGTLNIGGKYIVQNNKWGDGGAYQNVWTWRDGNQWGWGTYTYKNNGGINWPSIVLGWQWWDPQTSKTNLPTRIWNNANINTRADWRLEGQGGNRKLNVAYDLWTHNANQVNDGLDWRDQPKDEIMVWLHAEGGARPFGSYQKDVRIQGVNWELWRGQISTSQNTWNIFSFKAKQSQNKKALNLKNFIHNLVYVQGWMSNAKFVSSVQLGFEFVKAQGVKGHIDYYYCNVSNQ